MNICIFNSVTRLRISDVTPTVPLRVPPVPWRCESLQGHRQFLVFGVATHDASSSVQRGHSWDRPSDPVGLFIASVSHSGSWPLSSGFCGPALLHTPRWWWWCCCFFWLCLLPGTLPWNLASQPLVPRSCTSLTPSFFPPPFHLRCLTWRKGGAVPFLFLRVPSLWPCVEGLPCSFCFLTSPILFHLRYLFYR